MKQLIFVLFVLLSGSLNGQNSSNSFFGTNRAGNVEAKTYLDMFEADKESYIAMTYLDMLEANKNSYIITMTATFLAGAVNGINQDIQYHYSEFERTFPKANPQFWNPAISWENKHEWKDGQIVGSKFPMSRNILAFTTDGKHATDTARRLLTTASIVFSYSKKKNWKHYVLDAIILTAIRNLGFHLTYSLIIK